MDRHFETIIVGAGQAGLAVGYHLARSGQSFVILDASTRLGDSWRVRWDSLRVFTPAKYNGLPGMRFPAPSLSFPTKDEVADYMAAYAARFELPVRGGVKVDSVSRDGDQFEVASSAGMLRAANVVIATGACHTPKIPDFASQLEGTFDVQRDGKVPPKAGSHLTSRQVCQRDQIVADQCRRRREAIAG